MSEIPNTAQAERDEAALIEQRDLAVAAMGEAYTIVMGRPPEWSNRFGYAEALDELREESSWMIRDVSALAPGHVRNVDRE